IWQIIFLIVIFCVDDGNIIVNIPENPSDKIAPDKMHVDNILILYKKSIVEINVNQAFYGCCCDRI
ncbi:hypothetical protein EAY67_03270, partial [Salmonella enterica]|nr:hypothetical protein [Salmonella enterica]